MLAQRPALKGADRRASGRDEAETSAIPLTPPSLEPRQEYDNCAIHVACFLNDYQEYDNLSRSSPFRELIEILAISRNQKLPQPGEESQILELLIQRDGEFQELMKLAVDQGKIHHEMQLLEKVVEKRDNDIQQLQKQLKEAEHILATAVYQAKEKLKSIEKARKGAISSEEIIKYAHRISASNAVCAPLTWVPGDPRRPYPTDLEMRSGLLGQMNNPSTNGVNGHLPGDALAAGRLPDVLAPQYPWQSSDMSMNMLPPNHSNDFMLEPPGHNKENEDDVEVMSTDSSSSSSDSD
ncbi:PREDICTED: mediator of RNA polymerase II transcription subunit 4 [Ficedula albicollis]|nr:PREDICTED: mediator of RNA polymerase II transcription subunit 4 [Ficedula albicollis]